MPYLARSGVDSALRGRCNSRAAREGRNYSSGRWAVRSRRRYALLAAVVLASLLAGQPARADFFRDLTFGLSFLAGPIAPSGSRNGQFNLSYETLQRGWRADWLRAFGPDRFGRPNSIDFGVADLTLNSGTMAIRAQQFTRFMKGVELVVTTPTPINYTLSLNTGAQDILANGTIGITQLLSINEFGFYDLALSVSNRGDSNADGFLVADDATLDFDIGPVNISGNVYADILAMAAEPLFAGIGVQNPFAKFSGRATKEALVEAPVEAIRAKIEQGEAIGDAEMEALVNATLLASILGVTTPDLQFLQDAGVFDVTLEQRGAVAPVEDAAFAVPEPGTIALLGLPLLLLGLWRRRPA